MQGLSQAVEIPESRRSVARWAMEVPELTAEQTGQLLDRLTEFVSHTDRNLWPDLLMTLFSQIAVPGVKSWAGYGDHRLREIYRSCPADHLLRNQLLFLIGRPGTESDLANWVDLLIDDPPQATAGLELAFAPPLQDDAQLNEQLLARLIAGASGHSHIAAAVYDLCNHAYRTGKVASHPADKRRDNLRELLAALVGRLSQYEEGNFSADMTPQAIAATISNAVALVISLIDTLALLDDQASVGKLNQALELRHRRIQVEAAAALTRLGDDTGRKLLIEAVRHPVVRQRAIAYCRELELEDQISLEYTGPIATAESYLAMWLAEPAQMGLAPSAMELIDQRELYWPSYEDPVPCFLFRFEYGTGDQAYTNVGIHGPLTHAFAADLTGLATDDIYAAFSGWQTVSDEIFLIPVERARKLFSADFDRLQNRLGRENLEVAQVETAAGFFGRHLLVASATREGEKGTLVVSDEEIDFIGAGNERLPIDWRLALDLWIGRKLLTRFNPTFAT